MNDDLIQSEVLKIWNSNPSSGNQNWDQVPHLLPTDYLQFLSKTNGGSAKFPKLHFELWSLHELSKLNAQYQIKHYLGEQIVAIGTDGGPICFFFDYRNPKKITIGSINLGDLDLIEARTQAESFNDLLRKMLSGEIDDDDL